VSNAVAEKLPPRRTGDNQKCSENQQHKLVGRNAMCGG
jgi:hypothetical protein